MWGGVYVSNVFFWCHDLGEKGHKHPTNINEDQLHKEKEEARSNDTWECAMHVLRDALQVNNVKSRGM